MSRVRRVLAIGSIAAAVIFLATIIVGSVYSMQPSQLVMETARVVVTPVLRWWYRDDLDYVAKTTAQYKIPAPGEPRGTALESWQKLQGELPGLVVTTVRNPPDTAADVPFVYEQPDLEYLKQLREKYHLDALIADAPDEYHAMLKVAEWLGTRWDHGADKLVGTSQVCDPVAIIEAGQQGAKYWCEIASRTMVHVASSLSWPSRLITASRDGYTWEHALAEVWSDQFGKWFVIDADFNVIYESAGVPLSALELSRDGPRLQRSGKLTVRQFAPPKKSLPLQDMVPYYRYVHIDMRNDWCTRTLKRGSPAGGDLSTWWTARPDMPRLLTARRRVDDPALFDWPVNSVSLYAVKGQATSAGLAIQVALAGYSPEFARFELNVDGGAWEPVQGQVRELQLGYGAHSIEARVVTESGGDGPPARVELQVSPPAAGIRGPG